MGRPRKWQTEAERKAAERNGAPTGLEDDLEPIDILPPAGDSPAEVPIRVHGSAEEARAIGRRLGELEADSREEAAQKRGASLGVLAREERIRRAEEYALKRWQETGKLPL